MFYSAILPEKIKTKLVERKIIDAKDSIFAFYDDTPFLTGKKGILCLQDRVVVYGKQKVAYPFSEIKDIIYKEVDKNKYLYKMVLITTEDLEIDITPGSIPNDEMNLLIQVINNYRKSK